MAAVKLQDVQVNEGDKWEMNKNIVAENDATAQHSFTFDGQLESSLTDCEDVGSKADHPTDNIINAHGDILSNVQYNFSKTENNSNKENIREHQQKNNHSRKENVQSDKNEGLA